MTNYGRLPSIDLTEAPPVFSPAERGDGHWIGAPSGQIHNGTCYVAVRERTPTDRGHTVTIFERTETASYDEVIAITATELGVQSIERPALITDPRSALLQLYLPVDHGENDWEIQKLDDVTAPSLFDPETARPVLSPASGSTDAVTVKDPYIITIGERYYLYYSGHDGRSEQAHLATSVDGERWRRSPNNPILPRGAWHDYHTRISCVIPAGDGPFWHVFYEGSATTDYGNTWNLRTAHAVSFDLHRVIDTSPEGPWLSSQHDGADQFETCRYLEVIDHGTEWELLAETAREDGAFELRRAIIDPL